MATSHRIVDDNTTPEKSPLLVIAGKCTCARVFPTNQTTKPVTTIPPHMTMFRLLLCLLLLTITPRFAFGMLAGPYAPDSSTLHLWHMDAAAVPVPDAVSPGGTNLNVLANGATLGNASFAGFGVR